MKLADTIILFLVGFALAFALRRIISKKNSGCGCGCSSCTYTCSKKDKKKKSDNQ